MGTFTQYNPNALLGEPPFTFKFKTTRGLLASYERYSGIKLSCGWQYCIKDLGEHRFLMKFSLKEDSWMVLGVISDYPKELKLPTFNELFKKRKVMR